MKMTKMARPKKPYNKILRIIALAVVVTFGAESCLLAAPAPPHQCIGVGAAHEAESALRPVRERENRTVLIPLPGAVRSTVHTGTGPASNGAGIGASAVRVGAVSACLGLLNPAALYAAAEGVKTFTSEPLSGLFSIVFTVAVLVSFFMAVKRRGSKDDLPIKVADELRTKVAAREPGGAEKDKAVPRATRKPPADDSATIWQSQIRNTPLLIPEEEVALAIRIERGDERARKRMIESNLRLVLIIARERWEQGVSGMTLGDLVQEGNIGLIKAVEKFDYRKGFKFSTCVIYWIKQAIARAIGQKGPIIRLPAHIVEAMQKVRTVMAGLGRDLGRTPSLEEIATASGMTVPALEKLLSAADKSLSLDAPYSDDEDATPLGDFIEAPPEDEPDHMAMASILREQIEEALRALTSREEEVIRLRFGLDDGVPQTLEEIRHRLGVSKERVRQIEEDALKKLRRGGISLQDWGIDEKDNAPGKKTYAKELCLEALGELPEAARGRKGVAAKEVTAWIRRRPGRRPYNINTIYSTLWRLAEEGKITRRRIKRGGEKIGGELYRYYRLPHGDAGARRTRPVAEEDAAGRSLLRAIRGAEAGAVNPAPRAAREVELRKGGGRLAVLSFLKRRLVRGSCL